MTPRRVLLPLALLVAMPTQLPAGTLFDRLASQAGDADPQVLGLALRALQCASQEGEAETVGRMAVIDYSRPSTEPRLWVFDLDKAKLLYREHVAHGRGSGGDLAEAFSNIEGSHQTSLGLFRTAEPYHGGNGYSLRMDGLEPGINDRARQRHIVMHGADYVDPGVALRQGRLGRSFGCPAVRREVARPIIDTLKHGQLLFAYYPDGEWLAASRFLNCAEQPRQVAAAGGGEAERTPVAPRTERSATAAGGNQAGG